MTNERVNMEKGKCRYWNGLLNETCEKGVSYDKIADGSVPGIFFRLPCLTEDRGQERAYCSLYEEPSAEDISAFEAEGKASYLNLVKCLVLIETLKGLWGKQQASGKDICPVCKGIIHWSIDGFYGSISLHCKTANCVQIMA